MIACYDNDPGITIKGLNYLFCMFSYIGAHLFELNTNPENKFRHVMRLTYARWCTCPTDYMNKLEYVCLCWRLTGKLEELKVSRCSLDFLYNVKIGQGQLQLIIKHILFYHIWGLQPFWSSDLKQSQ